MAANITSRATYHGTYLPSQRMGMSSVASLSVPQMKSLLLSCCDQLPYQTLMELIPKEYGKFVLPANPSKEGHTNLQKQITRWSHHANADEIKTFLKQAEPKILAAINTGTITPPPGLVNSTIGYVLYEALKYIDKGIVKSDDVVSQFALPPQAEITIEKKSWSKVSIDFEEAESQLNEEEEESALSQNRELSEATSKQQQFNISLSTSAQGQGNWGVYSVTANAATSVGAAINTTRQESTKEKQDSTQKAASRARREHKLTIKRATEFGAETARVEKIKNGNKFHPVNYKFYKAVKKWEISHEVHGVSLCADVMVRNPGVNLRTQADRFDPNSIPAYNPFYLPEEIKPEPPEVVELEKVLDYGDQGRLWLPVYFVVPSGYYLQQILVYGDAGPAMIDGTDDPMMDGGDMGLWGGMHNVWGNYICNKKPGHTRNKRVTVKAVCFRKDELKNAYEQYAKEQMLEIYRKKWELEQDLERAKEKALDEERTSPATQILRQQERDELASAVAQFLLTGSPAPEPLSESGAASGVNLGQAAGRLVSIIHHSFAWEDASYFLYPYWWDSSVFGEMTIQDIHRIDHRDALRKAFLQASWARVLVPVRVDSERTILNIIYSGILEQIDAKIANPDYVPAVHADIVEAYVSLYKERNSGRFAIKDNLPEGNDPFSDSNVEQPKPIVLAQWTEYTPTDETYVEMEILKDTGGSSVNLGEPTALRAENLLCDRDEAVKEILSEVKDKIDGTKLTLDLVGNDSATISSHTGNGS